MDKNFVFQKLTKLQSKSVMNIKGISMEPILHEGDSVIVEPRKAYKIGDIIVYIYGKEGILAHRVIDVVGKTYICKGDNAFRIERVIPSYIIGCVTVLRRKNKTNFKLPDSLIEIQVLCELSKKCINALRICLMKN